jgi:hypothetical protein
MLGLSLPPDVRRLSEPGVTMIRFGFQATHTDGAIHIWYSFADSVRAAWLDFSAHYVPITLVKEVAIISIDEGENA